MVIGNGLIAKAFHRFKQDDKVVIVASGVSNSRNVDIKEFEREFKLVSDLISEHNHRLLVYFSSCSINNEKTAYTKHKLSIEKLIVNKCSNYLIFRLPLVLGENQNSNQLLGHLFNSLRNNKEIEVYQPANRYFIDSNDLPLILEHFIALNVKNEIMDIAFNNSISIVELVELIEKLTKLKFNRKIINKSSEYHVDNSKFMKIISLCDNSKFNLSLENMIMKYFVNEQN